MDVNQEMRHRSFNSAKQSCSAAVQADPMDATAHMNVCILTFALQIA